MQSLGCLLFAIAFGESPFERKYYESGASVALAAVSGRYVVPKDNPYSEKVTDLIAWLLKPNPAKRPFLNKVLEKLNKILGSDESDDFSAAPAEKPGSPEDIKFEANFEDDLKAEEPDSPTPHAGDEHEALV
jgi:serine/threonine protein kinase